MTLTSTKNQDKMLILGQPCIVIRCHVNNLHPVLRILKKNYVQTACESHDLKIVLVV